MEYKVEQKVLDAGVKIVFAEVTGINNRGESNEWKAYREAELARLYEEYKDIDVHADPVLEGYNILHDNTGVKRRKNIPASENLIKLLKKNQGMFYINQAVDIYNLISLQTRLCLGAHNIDRIEGNFTLRFTDGSERFQPIGQPAPIAVNAGEYSYCDDSNEVLCRLEIRQVEKTKVDESASNIAYIVQGNEATAQDTLVEAARLIVAQTNKYCGGSGRVIIPDII